MKQKTKTILLLATLLATVATASCGLFSDEPPPNDDLPPPSGQTPEDPNDEIKDGDEVQCPEFSNSYQGYSPTFQDRDEFSYHYNRWLKTCCSEDSIFSSRTQDYIEDHPDYEAIVEMGFRALPLIFEAMKEDGEFMLNSAAERITQIDDVLIERGEDPYQLLRDGMLGEQTRVNAWIAWWHQAESDTRWHPCRQNQPPTSNEPQGDYRCEPGMSMADLSSRFWNLLEQNSNLDFLSIDLNCDGQPNYAIWRKKGRVLREAWDFDSDGHIDWEWRHYERHSERRIFEPGSRKLTQRVKVTKDDDNYSITVDSFNTEPAQRLVYQQLVDQDKISNELINAQVFYDTSNKGTFEDGPSTVLIPAFIEFNIEVLPPTDFIPKAREPGDEEPNPMFDMSYCEFPDHVRSDFIDAVETGYTCLSELDYRLAESFNQLVIGSLWTLKCSAALGLGFARVQFHLFHLAGSPANQEMSKELIIELAHDVDYEHGNVPAVIFHEIMHYVLQGIHDLDLPLADRIFDKSDQVYWCEHYCYESKYLRAYPEVAQYSDSFPDKTPSTCAKCLGTEPTDPRCNQNGVCGDDVMLCSCTGEVFASSVECHTNCRAHLGCFTGICVGLSLPCEGSEQ